MRGRRDEWTILTNEQLVVQSPGGYRICVGLPIVVRRVGAGMLLELQ